MSQSNLKGISSNGKGKVEIEKWLCGCEKGCNHMTQAVNPIFFDFLSNGRPQRHIGIRVVQCDKHNGRIVAIDPIVSAARINSGIIVPS